MRLIFCVLFVILSAGCYAQTLSTSRKHTKQDTLRGSLGPERTWWDVLHYDITVRPDPQDSSIIGRTTIRYKVLAGQKTDYLQIDLQQPLIIDTIFYNGKLYINYPRRPYYREGNVWHIPLPKAAVNSVNTISIAYHGKPRVARNPPWDGGWIFKKDAAGASWMSVACQGLGASVWYPCKDHQSDEPDNGAVLRVVVAEGVTAVGNGRLLYSRKLADRNGVPLKSNRGELFEWAWEVKNPINTYNIVPYIGSYTSWSDTLMGEKGKLDLQYWVLQEDLAKAKVQFEQVKPMLRAFEYWFGAYPFYEDGFKLVHAPHLGMEHQSAVAYGNQFKNGYLGRDLSGSGWGLKWDFIIVHEAGHEWFANNITTRDIADMWVHEGFTNYSETLFTEYYYGKEAGSEYLRGIRKNIQNDIPVIGPYGVNQDGSGDMYAKGANLIHTIRQIMNDDLKFRQMLRGMNKDFYHSSVTSKLIEEYISKAVGRDLSKVFDQYLRTTKIPELEFKAEEDKLKFKWKNVVPGFNMPVRLTNGQWIYPTTTEQKVKIEGKDFSGVKVDPNFYIITK